MRNPYRAFLTLTMVVRNEEDIIEHNIRYHALQGVTRFLVMDHLSTDRTPEILRSLSKEFDVRVYRQEETAFQQDLWMSFLGAEAHRLGTEWVVTSDADEFWSHVGLPLAEAVRTVDISVDRIDGLWLNAMPYKVVPFYENTSCYRSTMPKTVYRAHKNPKVSVGSHWVYSASVGGIMPNLFVVHYPERSGEAIYKRFTEKAEALVKADLPAAAGEHWRKGYQAFTEGRLDEFVEGVRRAEDSIPPGEVLEYTEVRNVLRSVNRKEDIPTVLKIGQLTKAPA